MISSLKKQKGFTIVELLIVIVVIGILATLVIVTFAGIQKKGRDSQRQTDINAIASHAESFYAQYGYYPTHEDLTTASFLSTYMKGLDPQALVDPKGAAQEIIAGTTPDADQYSYQASVSGGGAGCVNTTATDPTAAVTTNNACDTFTAKALLEGTNAAYEKKSN